MASLLHRRPRAQTIRLYCAQGYDIKAVAGRLVITQAMLSKLSFGHETRRSSRWKSRSNGAATEKKVFEESRERLAALKA